ncbi:MAG: DUF1778 domain-containing protein [Microvirga sp.]|jgi:uncharacterized protein (DUF1778 family)|nr:DUF1778 domain-containing protein [Beijerinckiaceae bacterium]
MSTRPRTVRFRPRVTPETFALVARAAEIRGQSMNDFIAETAVAAAHRAIAQAELTRAVMEHHEAFARTIPKPTSSAPR